MTTATNPKAAPKSFSQTAGATAGTMQGEWVKKQDILDMPLIVYKAAVYPSRFTKGGETATFQIRLEADVTELGEDAPYYQFSSDSSRMVNIAKAVTGDDLPFRAALSHDLTATWVHDQFGQFPIIFVDPEPDMATSFTPNGNGGPVVPSEAEIESKPAARRGALASKTK